MYTHISILIVVSQMVIPDIDRTVCKEACRCSVLALNMRSRRCYIIAQRNDLSCAVLSNNRQRTRIQIGQFPLYESSLIVYIAECTRHINAIHKNLAVLQRISLCKCNGHILTPSKINQLRLALHNKGGLLRLIRVARLIRIAWLIWGTRLVRIAWLIRLARSYCSVILLISVVAVVIVIGIVCAI